MRGFVPLPSSVPFYPIGMLDSSSTKCAPSNIKVCIHAWYLIKNVDLGNIRTLLENI